MPSVVLLCRKTIVIKTQRVADFVADRFSGGLFATIEHERGCVGIPVE